MDVWVWLVDELPIVFLLFLLCGIGIVGTALCLWLIDLVGAGALRVWEWLFPLEKGGR